MATPGRPLDERTKNRLILMGEQGVNAIEAARALHVSPSTARRFFRILLDKNRQRIMVKQ